MKPKTKQLFELTLKAALIVFLIAGMLPVPGFGQTDSLKRLKNTIRINVTNPMIFGTKYNVIGYERVIRDYQTFSVSFGRFALPKFKEDMLDSLGVTDSYNDRGFNFSLDYRFYLRNENKHLAPRGVYLGPYYAYNYFNREQLWAVNTSGFTGEVTSDIKLTANLVGVQMGYQFVLWNRLTIDMILMGPGLWFFKVETDFNTSMPPEDEAALLDKINGLLEEKFPGKDLVLTGEGLDVKKVNSTQTMGLRYMINLGFRF